MAIYRIDNQTVVPVERTTFARQGLRERQDLQSLLKSQIEIISPNTLVVAEEFGEWDDSRRRIDLLGIDTAANLVVIELKRTEDGGHMELQALRYAAMISTLTFEKLVPIYQRYLNTCGVESDAAEALLEFLSWDEPDEEQFGQEVKIVLASAEFSRELTTSVMWLNEFGLDIRCVRMHPYVSGGQTFLDVQTVIPIPEIADYQVRIREKKQKERESRQSSRDLTKYDVEVAGEKFPAQSKRWMMFRLVSGALANGIAPQRLMEVIPWRKKGLFAVLEGELTSEQAQEAIMQEDGGGAVPRAKRFFCNDGEVFVIDGFTYVLVNQWGARTHEAATLLAEAFPELRIRFTPSE
ncbi:MAG: hypothetical protein RIC38_07740 [Chromatocurvus sp.]